MPTHKSITWFGLPGTVFWIRFSTFAHASKKKEIEDWGICGSANSFWLGKEVILGGKGVLEFSFMDALDVRNARFSEWGDEELFILFGTDVKTGAFYRFFLNERTFKIRNRLLEESRSYS